MNIRDITIKFSTEEQCLEYVEKMRWPDGIVRCPTCGDSNVKRVHRETTTKNRRHWFYTCLNRDCLQQFSPTAGTIFHDSHLPLIVWFHAIALVLNAKKGISAMQIQRDLNLGSYKTAWHLMHRIRESMKGADTEPMGGTIEIDETYIGGRILGKGVKYAKKQKHVVMGAKQRKGQVRFRHVIDANIDTMREFVNDNVSVDADGVMTDKHRAYPAALRPTFIDRHETVNHIAGEYVRGDVTTNGIESAFSLLKRGVMGQFHWLSGKHLHRYLSEFEYRFNRRQEPEFFPETVGRITRTKPLPFKQLTSGKKPWEI